MPEDILTICEVAAYLKVTERTLYRLVQDAKLAAFQGRQFWQFLRTDLERWISEQSRGTDTDREDG